MIAAISAGRILRAGADFRHVVLRVTRGIAVALPKPAIDCQPSYKTMSGLRAERRGTSMRFCVDACSFCDSAKLWHGIAIVVPVDAAFAIFRADPNVTFPTLRKDALQWAAAAWTDVFFLAHRRFQLLRLEEPKHIERAGQRADTVGILCECCDSMDENFI